MALKFPDILEHNNSNLPLVDVTELKGNSYPLGDLSEIEFIPTAKRNVGAIVFLTSSQEYYGFYGQTSSSIDWDDEANWRPLSSLSGSLSGSFSGSFEGDGSGLTGVTANIPYNLIGGTGVDDFTFDGSSPETVSIKNADFLGNEFIVRWDDNDNQFVNSHLQDDGTYITSPSPMSIQLTGEESSLSGSFSGSFFGDGYELTNIQASNITDLNLSQISTGTVSASVSDDYESAFKLTFSSTDIFTISQTGQVTANTVIINDDLTVLGTASFQNTENLLVADRFVLFASGSNVGGDGGIVVQQEDQGLGELYGFHYPAKRWGFEGSFDPSTSTHTPEAFVAAVIDINEGHSDTEKYQKNGNIKVDSFGEVWIYA